MLFMTDDLNTAQHPRKRRVCTAAGADIGILNRNDTQCACQLAVELTHFILQLDSLCAVHVANMYRAILPDDLIRI